MFKIKETKVEPQKEGKTSGKQFVATCTVVGGSQEGLNHFERFFEITKDNFSLSKLAGFLVKLGALKVTGPVDIAMFKTPEFEQKWLKSVPGREFGMKIGHRTKGADGQALDQPQSDAKSYYTLDETMAILKKEADKGGTAGTQPAPAAESKPEAAPASSAMWD